jgi:quinol monooxygenase YgiN
MTTSLIVVALGAVIAAVGTGVLTARCARTPRIFLIGWTVAVFGLAVSLAAQGLGDLAGYSDPMFRAMELGAQVIAPLALSLGLVELIARGLPGRFVMRLAVSAIGVIVLVIFGTDPLSATRKLSTSWPDPSVFYNLIPLDLIDFLAVFTVVTAVISALVVLVRSGRGPAYAEVTGPALTACAAGIIISAPGLMMFAHVKFGSTVFALVALLTAVLTWLAASSASRRGLADERASADRNRGRQPAGPGWYDTGDRHDSRYDVDSDDYLSSAYRDHTAHRAGATGTGQRYGDADADIAYPALAALAAERSDRRDRDSGRYVSSQLGSGQHDPAELGSAQFEPGVQPSPEPAVIEPYERRAELYGADGAQAGQMFGQITICTLLDDRLEDFDRMTERVVEQVRSLEPATLVYIVHGVPTAPMQRILYEVYRDRAAYDEHMAKPYVARYMAERRSMVLATNAIELGLQQAKVSPLPSYSAISDILSESGIDLTGVTKSSRAHGSQHGQTAYPRQDGQDKQSGKHGRTEPPEQPSRRPGGYDSHGDRLGTDVGEPGHQEWSGTHDEDHWYR